MKELLLAAFSVVSSIFIVILLVGFGKNRSYFSRMTDCSDIFIVPGWYIVWKAFLSRFRFVRELIGGMSENSTTTEQKYTRPRPRKARLIF